MQNETIKEETKAIQVPISEIHTIQKLIKYKFYRIPLYQFRINAGPPHLGDDYVEKIVDLNELLIKQPDVTFLLKVSGNSMIKAGIHHNDILVVDRSIEPADGKIVIASINGELTVKRLRYIGNKLMLVPENDDYEPIEINEDTELRIWGIATNVIHPL